jgi:hypothetical protein
MTTITWIILGAVGASVLWMFVLAWFIDVIGAQRKQLNAALTTTRLYRETRDDSDRQVRALLDQNERLARQLIDRAAESTTCASRPTMTAWPVMTRES